MTNLNYAQLETLYEKYAPRLQILAFPCNQFGQQEPGSNADILALAAKFNAKFKIMAKCDVVGSGAIPLFSYLGKKFPPPLCEWNFTKFLIAPGGIDIRRYKSDIAPIEIEKDIRTMLHL